MALVVEFLADAVPMAAANFFDDLPNIFSVFLLGHTRTASLDLSGMALGRSFFNCCWMIVRASCTGLQTLAPQAEVAGRRDLRRLYWQRGACVVVLICIPLSLIQFCAAFLLELSGQGAGVSARAQAYAIRCIPRMFGEGIFTILLFAGQAMGLASSIAVASVFSTMLLSTV